MTAIFLDPRSWPHLHPVLITHDVGGSRDRSTAVVGGFCTYAPGKLGITEFNELPQGLYGSDRASALAQIDARYDRNGLIFADLSNDTSYGEQLFETFGPRVIGVHIGRHGDGMQADRRRVGRGSIVIYHIGRSHLLEPCTVTCKRAEYASPMDRRRGALMPNWKRWSLKCARRESSINVCQGSMMISAFPAPS